MKKSLDKSLRIMHVGRKELVCRPSEKCGLRTEFIGKIVWTTTKRNDYLLFQFTPTYKLTSSSKIISELSMITRLIAN